MVKRVWAIVSTNWDYNDEYYTQAGNDHPTKAFTTREKAEAALLRENAIEARNWGENLLNLLPDSYYEGDKDEQWFRDLGAEVDGDLARYATFQVTAKTSDENIDKILKELGIVLNEICEIEVDE